MASNKSSFGKKFRFLIIVCIALLTAALFIIKGRGEKDARKKQHVENIPTVTVAQVVKKTVPLRVEYVANVDPTTAISVDIMARVEAFLETQNYKEGEPVKKGQVLFTLDKSTYIADLNSANAQVDTAKANLDAAQAQLVYAQVNEAQLKPLAKERAIPQLDYDNAVANLKVAKAKVEQAKAAISSGNAAVAQAKINLSYCTVYSPINGVAGQRLYSPGNLVGQGTGTKLTTVTSLNPLRVNFSISENDYILISKKYFAEKTHESDPVLDLVLADGSKYPYQGKIIIADPTLDPNTGTLTIVGEFSNPNYLLRPGMFGRVSLIADYAKDALLIPQKAVMMLQNSKNVYIIDKGSKVALRTIETGSQIGDMVIVKSGLADTDKVIVDGQLKVHPGVEVNPVNAVATEKK